MRRTLGIVLALAIGALIAWLWCRMGGGSRASSGSNPKEVNVLVGSLYAYHLAPNQKTLHLSLSNHESAFWTFDADSTVDSVTAVFGRLSPFASSHFEFSDSAAFSGTPTVGAGGTIYNYTITVYPHRHGPVTVDPGIIIDM